MSDKTSAREHARARRIAKGGAIAAALAIAVGARSLHAESAASAPATRPGLVFILADQLRYASVGDAGDKKARTPTLDRLASEGAER